VGNIPLFIEMVVSFYSIRPVSCNVHQNPYLSAPLIMIVNTNLGLGKCVCRIGWQFPKRKS